MKLPQSELSKIYDFIQIALLGFLVGFSSYRLGFIWMAIAAGSAVLGYVVSVVLFQ